MCVEKANYDSERKRSCVSHPIPGNNFNNRLRERVVGAWEGGERKGHRKPSISSSSGRCLSYGNCSFKDTRTRWLCILPCHFLLWDREDQSWHAEDSCWSGAEPSQRAGSLRPQLATKAPEWRCEVSLWPLCSYLPWRVWRTGGSRQHTCKTCSASEAGSSQSQLLNH